ncbi:class B sortase [Clostridium sp. 2218st1_F5_2218SCRN_220325]|uniref:class B sortase n=1 Tax=Clostridium sp. 2218st1_F5_2218SCRN_220325 TaxID=3143056 RepID=UPI00319E311C
MKLKTGIKNLITFFLIAIICVCGYRIYEKLNDYKKADDLYANLRTEKEVNLDKNNSNSGTANTIDLSSINKDFVCWINIENTNIDYPVVQSKDNSYYLHRDIYGNYLYAGTTFLDYRDYYDDSKNLIIYGHNMKNTTMFSQLEKFKEESFFKSNPTITLTDKNGEKNYEVFAVLLVKKDYPYTIPNFNSDDEYNKFLNKIVDDSIFSTQNKPTSSDKILTLSTCSYEFKDARTVVFCKEKKIN